MIEHKITSDEDRVVNDYISKSMEDIWNNVDDCRCNLTDKLVESLHSDAHWIPKAGCKVPDGQIIISFDENKDLMRDYFMVKVCKEMISNCEAVISRIQDDYPD